MAKAPAFQLYVRDWLTDTELSSCSPATRGVWIDMLANMWVAPERGTLQAKAVHQLARMCRCTDAQMEAALGELKIEKVARVTVRSKKVTVTNRRMARDEAERKSHAQRQKRYRGKRDGESDGKSDALVTSPSASASASAQHRTSREVEYDDGLFVVADAAVERFEHDHPGVSVDECIVAAEAWLRDNPGRIPKNPHAFLNRWLNRERKDAEPAVKRIEQEL